MPAADLDGLAWVTDRVATPVMADESVYGVRDLVEVIRRRAADLVNVKLAKCGGLPRRRHAARAGARPGHGQHRRLDDGDARSGSARPPAWSPRTARRPSPTWTPPGGPTASPVVGGMTYDGATVVLPDAPGLGDRGALA